MTKEQELLDAARSGNVNTMLKLLDTLSNRNRPFASMRRSLNINYKDVNGHTALHHACLHGHFHIVRMLLKCNALVDVPDVSGSTPLYWAAWAGHLEIVQILLLYNGVPANPNALTKKNETPLHCAAQHNRNEVVKLLLQFGADPTLRNDSFQTPLDLAATYGRLAVVETLLRTHPELLACYQLRQHRSITAQQSLEQNSAAYDITPTEHIFTHTCLHLASRNGHKDVVETLLKAGVYVNVQTPVGTALHEAAAGGRKAVVAVLLAAGIDVNAQNCNGLTALDLLKDLPTYEIFSMIKDFPGNQRQQTTRANAVEEMEMDSDFENNNDFVPANNQLSNKVPDLLPKNANLQAHNRSPNFLLEQQQLEQQQSISLASPEFYLKMKPVYWPTAVSKPLQVPVYKPVYKVPSINGNQSKTTALFRPIKSTGSDCDSISMRSNTTPRPYRISSDYVEMSEPMSSETSRSSTPKKQQQQARLSTHSIGDFANLQPQPAVQQLPLPSKAKLTDANNNHNNLKLHIKHSPTPDFPPPTFKEAEQTISKLLFTMSRRVNYQMESYTLREESPESINSQISDCVETFLGDGGPYAGLYKGSTLNLNLSDQDQVDGYERTTRKMTPGLCKSRILKSESVERIMQQQQQQRQLVNVNYGSTHGLDKDDDDINVGKEWQEIDSIFESIGQEMSEAHEDDATSILDKQLQTNVQVRQPAELLLGLSSNLPNNWLHDTNKLIYEEIMYKVYYLGSTIIRQLYGTASTRKSIQKLKIDERLPENVAEAELLQDCNNSTKYLKAKNAQTRLQLGIAISHTGVEFIDLEKQLRICAHAIANINCVCQDAEDMRYFAYITRECDMHYSHVFMVDDVKLAAEIILTLGQAFEIAYQLMLQAQQQTEQGCSKN